MSYSQKSSHFQKIFEVKILYAGLEKHVLYSEKHEILREDLIGYVTGSHREHIISYAIYVTMLSSVHTYIN